MRQVDEVDLFGDEKDAWITKARLAQYKLESVRNSYVGNKRKMLVNMARIFYEENLHTIINGGKVLDLFSGSSFVSYLFKSLGASVWSNDLLASSFLNAVAFIQNDEVQFDYNKYVDLFGVLKTSNTLISSRFDFCDRLTKKEQEILSNFYNNFFHKFNLQPGDCVNFLIENSKKIKLGSKKRYEDPLHLYEPSLLLVSVMHYIMNRCYVGGRLNNGQILANLEHRLEHARNQGYEMQFNDIPSYSIAFKGSGQCLATRMDAISLLKDKKPDVDIIYIDPPYGGQQSDYSTMYDFFEIFLRCYRDENKDISSQRFIKSKNYENNFDELLSSLPIAPVWVFSYNDSSWADCEKISSKIKQYKQNVNIREIEYEYQYRNKENSSGVEYLIIAK